MSALVFTPVGQAHHQAKERSYMEAPLADPYRPYELRRKAYEDDERRGLVPLHELFIFDADFGNPITRHVKTKEEVHQWMKCHTNSENYKGHPDHEDYWSMISYIEAAAEAFDMPYALIACKLWQESKWSRKAISTSNAKGLAQFKEGTIREYNRILRWSRPMLEVEEELEEVLHQRHKHRKYDWEKDIRYLTRALRNSKRSFILLPKWKEYVRLANQADGPFEVYPTTLSKDGFCQHNGCSNWEYNNPLWSIGGAALYLTDIYFSLDVAYRYKRIDEPGIRKIDEGFFWELRELDDVKVGMQVYNFLEPLEFLLLGVSAYNTGLGNYTDKLIEEGANFQEWLALSKKSSKENFNHMRKIQACLQPGNFIHPTDNPVGEGAACKKPR